MDFLKTVINRREGLSPQVKDILNRKGDAIIHSIKVGRTPVQAFITGVIKAVASTPYDTLFHLFIQMETSKGLLLLQKNAVIHMAEGRRDTDIAGAEWLEVPSVPQISVNQLLENTQNEMGAKFIPYHPGSNNCQDFIMGVLTSNGMNDPTVLDFVKQDTKSIFKSPTFRRFAASVTNLGGSFDVLLQGGAISHKFKNNELTNYQLQDLMAKYRLQYNGSYVKDRLPTVLRNGNYIINLNGESHWTALIKDKDKYYYFDSYGVVPAIEVQERLNKDYAWNPMQLQDIDSSSCGFYCVAFLRYMSKYEDLGKGFESFVRLFSSDTAQNEKILGGLLA